MPFERFTQTGRSFKPKISIRSNSQIGLNCACITEFKLTDYKFAVLYYDKENKAIGIRLTNDKNEEGACKLRAREDSGASIAARSYIDYYKLHRFNRHRFDAEWSAKEQMIIAKLD